jgi:hypothetical protein
MTGLRGDVAIVGVAWQRPERKYIGPRRFTLEEWADHAGVRQGDDGISLPRYRPAAPLAPGGPD